MHSTSWMETDTRHVCRRRRVRRCFPLAAAALAAARAWRPESCVSAVMGLIACCRPLQRRVFVPCFDRAGEGLDGHASVIAPPIRERHRRRRQRRGRGCCVASNITHLCLPSGHVGRGDKDALAAAAATATRRRRRPRYLVKTPAA